MGRRMHTVLPIALLLSLLVAVSVAASHTDVPYSNDVASRPPHPRGEVTVHPYPVVTQQASLPSAAFLSCLCLLFFCVSLVASILPFLLCTGDQFTRATIRTCALLHMALAGIMMCGAIVVLVPNVAGMAGTMHEHLPTPLLPYLLLFLSLLLPLLCDRLLLALVLAKPKPAAQGFEAADTREGLARTSGSLSVPVTPVHRASAAPSISVSVPSALSTPRHGPPSRKGSWAAVAAGTGAGAGGGGRGTEEESKRSTRSIGSHSGIGTLAIAAGIEESQPLTGGLDDVVDTETGAAEADAAAAAPATPSIATPSSTYYGSARLSVDAGAYKSHQRFLSRCAWCKENITTSKGAAYHAAGCALKSFHAFTFNSRWMQALRGRRSVQRDLVMGEEVAVGLDASGRLSTEAGAGQPPFVWHALTLYVAVMCLYSFALAGCINVHDAARVEAGRRSSPFSSAEHAHAASWLSELLYLCVLGLVILCMAYWNGFALGMMLMLHRINMNKWSCWLSMLVYACSLPLCTMLNYVLALSLASSATGYQLYVLVCQYVAAGTLVYIALVDIVLEELARSDVTLLGKCLCFGIGAALVAIGAGLAASVP